MAPKKSKFIWFIIISFSLGLILNVTYIIPELVSLNLDYILSYHFFLNLVVGVLSAIFLYKLYYLKEDVVRWTHIAYVSNILFVLVGFAVSLQQPLPEEAIEEIHQVAQEMGISVGEATELIELMTRFITRFMTILFFVIIFGTLLFWFFFSRHLKKFLNKKTEELGN